MISGQHGLLEPRAPLSQSRDQQERSWISVALLHSEWAVRNPGSGSSECHHSGILSQEVQGRASITHDTGVSTQSLGPRSHGYHYVAQEEVSTRA